MFAKIIGFGLIGVLVFLAYKQIKGIIALRKKRKEAKNSPLADKQEDNIDKGEKVKDDRNRNR